MPEQSKERSNISFRFQLTAMAMSVSLMLTLIAIRSRYTNTQEKKPNVHTVTPEKFHEFGGFSKIIKTGLHIEQFLELNMITNQFICDGLLWFKFDPGAIDLDTLGKFAFEKGELQKVSAPAIRLIAGELLVEYAIRLNFKTDLDYTDFPFDNHEINLVFFNQYVTPNEALFESSSEAFTITADTSSTGWNMINKNIKNGYLETALDAYNRNEILRYPAIVFSIDFARNSLRYTSSILMPLALVLYLMFFSLSIPQSSTAIGITASGITAILAYRFVIEGLAPKNGFFMMSDFMFFLFLALVIAIFIANVAEESLSLSLFHKKILLIMLHILLIISIYFIFFG